MTIGASQTICMPSRISDFIPYTVFSGRRELKTPQLPLPHAWMERLTSHAPPLNRGTWLSGGLGQRLTYGVAMDLDRHQRTLRSVSTCESSDWDEPHGNEACR